MVMHESLDLRQSYRLLAARKDLKLGGRTEQLFVRNPRPQYARRKDEWVFVRSMRASEWRER